MDTRVEMGRIAHLRRIHAHLIAAEESEEEEPEGLGMARRC